MIIAFKNENDDKFNQVTISQATISIATSESISLGTFYTGDEKEYQVKLYISGLLEWSGFIMPDSAKEPFLSAPYEASLKATDLLATLKTIPFTNDLGRPIRKVDSIKNILLDCLNKTGLNLDLVIGVNTYEDTFNKGINDCPLEQTFIDTNRFIDTNNKAYSCFDIVQSICSQFTSNIKQVAGSWWMVDISEVRRPSYRARRFSFNGVKKGSEEVKNIRKAGLNLSPEVGLKTPLTLVDRDHDIQNIPGYKSVTTYYQFGYLSNTLVNGDLNETQGVPWESPFVGWNIRNGLQVSVGEKTEIIDNTGIRKPNGDKYAIIRNDKGPSANLGVDFAKSFYCDPVSVLDTNFVNVSIGVGSPEKRGSVVVFCWCEIYAPGQQTSFWSSKDAAWITENKIRSLERISTSRDEVTVSFRMSPPPFSGSMRLHIIGATQTLFGAGSGGDYFFNNISISLDQSELNKAAIGLVSKSNQVGSFSESPDPVVLLIGDDTETQRTSWMRNAAGKPTATWNGGQQLQRIVAKNILNQYQKTSRLFEGSFRGGASPLDVIQIDKTGGSFYFLSGDFAIKSGHAKLTLAELFPVDVAVVNETSFLDYGDFKDKDGKTVGTPSGITIPPPNSGADLSNYVTREGYNKYQWDTAFSWGDHSGRYPLYNGSGAFGNWNINSATSNYSQDSEKWAGRKFDDWLNQPVRKTDRVEFVSVVADTVNSKAFVSGVTGTGYKINADGSAEFDSMTIRKELNISTLNVREITGSGGSLAITNVAKISSVVTNATDWRCSIDTDGNTITVQFRVNDIVRCQVWDGKRLKYYTGRIKAVGTGYFDLDKTGTAGSGVPASGDSVFQFGNTSDTTRQGLIYITNSDTGAPYIDILDGVNSDNLSGKTKVRLGKLSGINDPVLGQLDGYGLYADNAYIKGKIIITGGNAATTTQVDAAQAAANTAQTAAANAKTAADSAQISANTANQLLADISNDNLLTVAEKQDVLKEWQQVQGEYPVTVSQAATYSVSSSPYTTQFNNLQTYLSPYLTTPNVNSTIVGTTFRATFKAYYDAKVALLKAISDAAKQLTDTAQTTASAAQTAATNAKTAADDAKTAANTANAVLAQIADDNLLMPSEKQDVLKEWQIIQGELPIIQSQAATYAIPSVTYVARFTDLQTYLTPLLANMGANTVIVGTTFRSTFKAYYDAKQTILKQISDAAKSYADTLEGSGINLVSSVPVNWEQGYYQGGSGAPVSDNRYIRSKDSFEIQPSTKYTISCSTGNRVVLIQFDANNNVVVGGTIDKVATAKSISFTSVATAIKFRLYGDKDPLIAISPDFVLELKPKLEKGSVATPWVQSPEDVTATSEALRLAALSAQSAAANAQTSANTANQLLSDISNDDLLTVSEKQDVLKEWQIIQGELPIIQSQAATYAISSVTYTARFTDLQTYLAPLLANMGINTVIVGTTFRATFKAYYDAKVTLLKAISDAAKGLINNISVGSRNIISNGDFRRPLPSVGWVLNGGIAQIQTVDNLPAVWIQSSASGNGIYSYDCFAPGITIKPDTEYVISFDVKGYGYQNDNRILQVGINGLSTVNNITVPSSDVWTRVSNVIKTPTNFNLRQTIVFYGTGGLQQFWFRNLKMVEGNKGIDWSPAPEDLQKDAQDAQTAANTANAVLAQIADDNLLMPSEKQDVLKEWQIIQGELPIIQSQAATYAISSATYTARFTDLQTYLTPLFANMGVNSVIVGTTFRATFKAYYDAKIVLLKSISDAAKGLADAAQNTANTAQTAAANAKTAADSAQISANTANQLLADISNDNLLTVAEKQDVLKEWQQVQGEYPVTVSQAATYSVSSSPYTTQFNNLQTYLSPYLTTPNVNSTIVGTTFRATFKAYYDAKVALLKAISDAAKTYADNIEGSGINLASSLSENWEQGYWNAAGSGEAVATNIHIRTKDFITIEPNTKYVISSAQSQRVVLLQFTSAGVYIPTAFKDKTSALISLAFTSEPNAGMFKLYANNIGNTAITPAFVTSLLPKIEKGGKSTPWTQSPKDIVTSFASANDFAADKANIAKADAILAASNDAQTKANTAYNTAVAASNAYAATAANTAKTDAQVAAAADASAKASKAFNDAKAAAEAQHLALTNALKPTAYQAIEQWAIAGNSVFEGGKLNVLLLDAAYIRANIVTADYVTGLDLNFIRGSIGGIKMDANSIFSSNGNFKITATGDLVAKSGTFGGWVLDATGLKDTQGNGNLISDVPHANGGRTFASFGLRSSSGNPEGNPTIGQEYTAGKYESTSKRVNGINTAMYLNASGAGLSNVALFIYDGGMQVRKGTVFLENDGLIVDKGEAEFRGNLNAKGAVATTIKLVNLISSEYTISDSDHHIIIIGSSITGNVSFTNKIILPETFDGRRIKITSDSTSAYHLRVGTASGGAMQIRKGGANQASTNTAPFVVASGQNIELTYNPNNRYWYISS